MTIKCDHKEDKKVTLKYCLCFWLDTATRITNCWCTEKCYENLGEDYKKHLVIEYALGHRNEICEDPKNKKYILRVSDCPNEKCEMVKKWNPLGWHYYECILMAHKSIFIPKEQ
jgi:hypothetical protein